MTTSQQRLYPGAYVGEQLCAYLNSPRHSKRAFGLLSDLQRATQFKTWSIEEPKWKVGDLVRTIVADPEVPTGHHVRDRRITERDLAETSSPQQRKRLWARIKRLLRTYTFTPELDDWIKIPVKATDRRGRWMTFRWKSRQGQEGIAVLCILELLRIGRLDRVRRCENCSTLFFSAVKQDGKYCSIKCQRESYRSREETRAQHREYMRTWRSTKEREKGNESEKRQRV